MLTLGAAFPDKMYRLHEATATHKLINGNQKNKAKTLGLKDICVTRKVEQVDRQCFPVE